MNFLGNLKNDEMNFEYDNLDNKLLARAKANAYIQRILMGAYELEHYRMQKPIVFMSRDVMAAIASGEQNAVIYSGDPDITQVCGYDVKFTYGKEELYVGFEA